MVSNALRLKIKLVPQDWKGLQPLPSQFPLSSLFDVSSPKAKGSQESTQQFTSLSQLDNREARPGAKASKDTEIANKNARCLIQAQRYAFLKYGAMLNGLM